MKQYKCWSVLWTRLPIENGEPIDFCCSVISRVFHGTLFLAPGTCLPRLVSSNHFAQIFDLTKPERWCLVWPFFSASPAVPSRLALRNVGSVP